MSPPMSALLALLLLLASAAALERVDDASELRFAIELDSAEPARCALRMTNSLDGRTAGDCATDRNALSVRLPLTTNAFLPLVEPAAKVAFFVEVACARPIGSSCPDAKTLSDTNLPLEIEGVRMENARIGKPVELKLDDEQKVEFRDDNTGRAVTVTFTMKVDGPRGERLKVGADEYLLVRGETDSNGNVQPYHANRVEFAPGARLRLDPAVDRSDKGKLLFSPLSADIVEFERNTKIFMVFPAEYEPEFGDTADFTAVIGNRVVLPDVEDDDEELSVSYAPNDKMKATESLAIKADIDEQLIQEGQSDPKVILQTSFILFDEEEGTPDFGNDDDDAAAVSGAAECDDEDDCDSAVEGGNNRSNTSSWLRDNAVLVGAVGGGVVLLCCVIIVVVCFVRKVRRDALAYDGPEAPSGVAMQSARDYGTVSAGDGGYLSAEHEPLYNGNSFGSAPGGSIDARTSYSQPSYDRVPEQPSMGANTDYAPASTMALPPKIDDFDQSVYAAVPEALRKENDPWELSFDDLQLGRKLGEGAYGTVHEARYGGMQVAVKQMHTKMLKEKDINDFKKEAKLMKGLEPHPSVVRLVGVNTDESKGPLFIVTEFCGGGACDSYLKKYGHLLNPQQRLSMMVAAARGVQHLHKQSIIHRDLAARNFLLTNEGALKVADFGMSRDLQEDGNQTKCEIGPLRYMAPESMAKRVYSVESDCWAFGVVCWEICSNAATPYGTMPLTQVAIGVAKEGLRLDQPEECPDALYELMLQCWQHEPEDRVPFATIDHELLRIAHSL